ncbi:MAG: hypothetical protein NTY38_20540 [Acidobacteria bacterium]|nr:hypothetical protein [Acidobacteriota bacterium]
MKYWAYLLAKLAVAGAALVALWLLYVAWFPPPDIRINNRPAPFVHDLNYTLAVLIYGLIAVGVLYLVIRDQRYRCRTCVRRLRMPVETGSWESMLRLGMPRTEYICPYGHGTLKVPEVQITGHEGADWAPNEDIWKELAKR